MDDLSRLERQLSLLQTAPARPWLHADILALKSMIERIHAVQTKDAEELQQIIAAQLADFDLWQLLKVTSGSDGFRMGFLRGWRAAAEALERDAAKRGEVAREVEGKS